MHQRLKSTLLTVCLITGMGCAHAETTLMDVYREALHNDPTLQAARAAHLRVLEQIPQARAALLPQVSVSNSANRSHIRTHGTGSSTSNGIQKSNAYEVDVSQALFDYNSKLLVDAARANAKSADAAYAAAVQDLMQRVASLYFNVLQNRDILTYVEAKKRAIGRELEQAQQRYKVGLDTITSVYDAQAAFDGTAAEYIAQTNAVSDALEQLREVTGVYHEDLAPLIEDVPLVPPKPANIDHWVDLAKRQNLQVVSSRYNVIAAQQSIKAEKSGRLPVVSLDGSYNRTYTHRPTTTTNKTDVRTSSLGLSLTMPVFQGGLVSSKIRASVYAYQESLANLESDLRSAMVKTRQDYLGILSIISQIKADKQAILSNKSAVEGAEAQLEVGTKTTLDLLNAQENLFEAQRNYATDIYTYINDIISLKVDIGTLDTTDLKLVNSWLQPGKTDIKKKTANNGKNGAKK